MAYERSKSSRDNFGKFINQFKPKTKTLIWKLERILIIYICIYIYYHPQIDCFVLSELFSVARHAGRSKPGSKPIQLYARLRLRPLGQQAYHVWLREFLRYYVVTAAAVCLHFLYPIGYQSAQFFRRALHYANGGRKFLHQSAHNTLGKGMNPIILLSAMCKL